ncbi:MAG: hypothetical protein QM504_07445, partial [Pseudomonadota bacterium]
MTLDKRFNKFMSLLSSIENIDLLPLNKVQKKEKRADYFGWGRKIIFEQKCINQDQGSKIQSIIDKCIEGKLLFYGELDFNQVIESLPNKENIKRKIYSQITKLIEKYLYDADKQIASTKNTFKLSNSVGVLVILNEKVEVLSPEVVGVRINQRLREKKKDEPRFNNIDYVIFISEIHRYNGLPCVIIFEGEKAKKHPQEISDYLDSILDSWSRFNGGETLQVNDINKAI